MALAIRFITWVIRRADWRLNIGAGSEQAGIDARNKLDAGDCKPMEPAVIRQEQISA